MKNKIKNALITTAVLGSLTFAGGAMAQSTTPVDDLEAEMDKLTDVYDDVVPVAIGAAAFSIGMVLIKRVAFS